MQSTYPSLIHPTVIIFREKPWFNLQGTTWIWWSVQVPNMTGLTINTYYVIVHRLPGWRWLTFRWTTWVWQSVNLDLMISPSAQVVVRVACLFQYDQLTGGPLGSDNQSTWIWQSVQGPNLGKQWQPSLHTKLKSFLPVAGNFVICIINICLEIINE